MSEPETRHPRSRWLTDLADGALTGRRAEEIGSHVQACARCAGEVEDVRAMTAALAAGPLPAPPRAVMRRVDGLFASLRVRRAAERVGRLVASLLFDQRLEPVPALRSCPGSGRRLLWAVGPLEIVATLTRDAEGWELRGQVLPQDDDGVVVPEGEISLSRTARGLRRARLDDQGEFRFDGLAAGVCELEGRVDGVVFRIPPFVVE